jgi:hypothetical protein
VISAGQRSCFSTNGRRSRGELCIGIDDDGCTTLAAHAVVASSAAFAGDAASSAGGRACYAAVT